MTKPVTLNSKPTLMINVNHGPELFSVPISYDATQTHPQTLNTVPRDPPKDPKQKTQKRNPPVPQPLTEPNPHNQAHPR